MVYITDTAFVSHNLTLEGYGELRMPMLFATADHLTIAQSSAHNDLFVKVKPSRREDRGGRQHPFPFPRTHARHARTARPPPPTHTCPRRPSFLDPPSARPPASVPPTQTCPDPSTLPPRLSPPPTHTLDPFLRLCPPTPNPNQVCETLGLEFVGNSAFDEFYEMQNSEKGKRRNKKTAGTTLLTERLLRDATVLDADILKVMSDTPKQNIRTT